MAISGYYEHNIADECNPNMNRPKGSSHIINIFPAIKPRTCSSRALKEISSELVEGLWDPYSPTIKLDISFRSLHEHCSWLYLITFIVCRQF